MVRKSLFIIIFVISVSFVFADGDGARCNLITQPTLGGCQVNSCALEIDGTSPEIASSDCPLENPHCCCGSGYVWDEVAMPDSKCVPLCEGWAVNGDGCSSTLSQPALHQDSGDISCQKRDINPSTYCVSCNTNSHWDNTQKKCVCNSGFVLSGTACIIPDTTPPVISNPHAYNIRETSATISVTTNEDATCRWSPGQYTLYSSMSAATTTSLGTSHSWDVIRHYEPLQPGTQYTFYVICRDSSGNENTQSTPITFTTIISCTCSGTSCNPSNNGQVCNGCNYISAPAETCNNIDDNCDGSIDNGLTTTSGCNQVGYCSSAYKTCSSGVWGSCSKTPQSESCSDGIDNDCDGEKDWDTLGIRGPEHGDNDCPVSIISVSVSNSNPCPDEVISVSCGSSVGSVNSVKAFIGGTECLWKSDSYWSGNTAVFTGCSVGTAGTKQVTCSVDLTKSYAGTLSQSTPITVKSSSDAGCGTCAGKTLAQCSSDSRCEYCYQCNPSSPKQYSGGSDRCVTKGACSYYCDNTKCSAECDQSHDPYCSSSCTLTCTKSGPCTGTICPGYWCSSGQVCMNTYVWDSTLKGGLGDCKQAAMCEDTCPYTLSQSQYWTTSGCFSGEYSCCEVNYGTLTTDWVKIDVINPQS